MTYGFTICSKKKKKEKKWLLVKFREVSGMDDSWQPLTIFAKRSTSMFEYTSKVDYVQNILLEKHLTGIRNNDIIMNYKLKWNARVVIPLKKKYKKATANVLIQNQIKHVSNKERKFSGIYLPVRHMKLVK